MKKHILFVLALVTCALFAAAILYRTRAESMRRLAGVALTFDAGSAVQTWGAARDFLREQGIRATFFVSNPSGLREADWNILRKLQADGHEIGCHGLRHHGVGSFRLGKGVDARRFVAEEVLPTLAVMATNGFYPTAFAYPGGATTPEVNSLMLRHFKVVRPTQGRQAKYSGRRQGGVIGALSLDRPWKDSEINALLDEVRQDGSIMVFAGHRIGGRGYCWTDTNDLETIARAVRDQGLRFYTMSELASDLPPDAHPSKRRDPLD